MTGRRAIIGLCMLCALAVSALAAQSASAATNGTTAFTCKAVTPVKDTVGFSKAHCKPEDAVSTLANYEHFPVAEKTKTELSGGSTDTSGNPTKTTLKSTISGVNVELQSTHAHGTGSMENKQAASGEHTIHGEGKITYTGVSVTAPAGKGCVVEGGQVITKQLTGTTEGQGHNLKFQPASGSVFATFNVTGCSIAALNGIYEVTGSVSCPVIGATTVCTHAAVTGLASLKLRGQNAGIEGELTISGRDVSTEPFTPLSATTVAT